MCIRDSIYACNENRIANLKGFGLKTQQELIENLQYAQAVSYTHLRAHETVLDLACRLLLEKKNKE